MRNRTFYAMALVVAFTVGATIPFAAIGADLPQGGYKSAAYPQPPSYLWAGGHIGLMLGYGYADADSQAMADKFDFTVDGALGGVLLGYSWQSGTTVIGLEGDLVASDLTGSQTYDASVDWIGGLRGRAGILVSPQLLLFTTLGYGWANIDLPVAGGGGGWASKTFGGFQVGGGLEMKLLDDWGARVDYLYTGLDNETIAYPGASVTYEPGVHQFRGALTHRF